MADLDVTRAYDSEGEELRKRLNIEPLLRQEFRELRSEYNRIRRSYIGFSFFSMKRVKKQPTISPADIRSLDNISDSLNRLGSYCHRESLRDFNSRVFELRLELQRFYQDFAILGRDYSPQTREKLGQPNPISPAAGL